MKSIFFVLPILLLIGSVSCKSSDDATDTTTTKTTPLEMPLAKSGWDIYVAGTYHYGPSIIINSDGTIDAWFAAAGSYFGTLLFPEYDSSHSAVQLSGSTTTAAQKFTADGSFCSIMVCCPTWGTSDANLTFSLYNWKGDYNTTVAETPVATQTFTGVADNSKLMLSNTNMFPAGDYLWVLSNPANTIGVWKYASQKSGTQSYLNGTAVDGSYEAAILPNDKVVTFWDQIAYRKSTDGGKTWTKDQMVVKPTLGSRDAFSVCDPGVAQWGGYYYLGYTSTEDSRGTDNHAYICRSTSPAGPWEKWNGSGWGGNPQPVITYTGDPQYFGAGEPCMVVKDGIVYFYYSWNAGGTEGCTTRVATADASDANWPAHLTVKGTAINKTGISGADHCDVKYREDIKKFQAIHTASRMTANSYIVLWESTDGINFTKVGELHNNLKSYLHNCGWSGDAQGHISGNIQQYLSYAYGSTWAAWNTYWQPLILKE